LEKYLHQQGFSKGSADSNLYIKIENDKLLILVVVVAEKVVCADTTDLPRSLNSLATNKTK